jgi:Domain of unknown function (DUF4399)
VTARLLRRRGGVAALLALALPIIACADDNADTAHVSLSEPTDGATLAGGVPLRMVADGIDIEEAGEVRDGAGHFHLIADAGCVSPGTTIPRDVDHVHFGAGQSEGTIYLEPGTHELCLQAGDGAHAALDATDTVTITVDITSVEQWCAVVEEVGDLFEAVDTADEPFDVKQLGYQNVRRLFAQLAAGTTHLEADIRDGVEADLRFGDSIANAFVEAADPAAAEAAVAQIEQDPLVADGVASVSETCDVDLGG